MSKPTGKLIRLTAGDVGAYTKTEADTKIADAKKAGTDANTNANGRVPTSRKVNGKPLTADINLTAGDVGAYTKTEADTKIADAKKAGTDANTNANGRVPTSRKINGKPLTADISLTAGDVSAYTKTETDNKISAAAGIGYGQDWVDVKSERKYGVVYTNTTNKPIFISVFTNADSTLTIDVRKNSAAPWVIVGADSARGAVPNNFIVPANYQYRVNSYFGYWAELR